MSLIDDIRVEQARLEATRRRKGIVTVALLRESLPPFLRNQASSYQLGEIVAAINRALDDADPVTAPPTIDHQSRAAGEGQEA